MEKKKIKGFSKKYMSYAGIILAGALMGLSPQKVSATENNIAYEQEINNETDFEKYFQSDVPMDTQSQITTESDIYKILSFYEGGAKAENGEFEIQLDPADNLVVASGLTVKFQETIIKYLTETYNQDIETIKERVKAGEKIDVPSDIIEKCFVDEIQNCRNNAIESAQKLNINLGESQINVLTELNYRYGKKQSESFLEFVSKGNKIEDYSVRILRSMKEDKWENSDIHIYSEVVSNEDGNINYYAYEKPFEALRNFSGSIKELDNMNIENEVEKTEMQFEGDKRRALFRQIGIMYNVSPIIINNDGICRCTIDGVTQEIPLTEYLSNYEKKEQNNENQKIENQTDENKKEDSKELEDVLETVVDEINTDDIDEKEKEEIHEIFQDNSSTKIEQSKEDEHNKQEETALVPVEKKKKFNIFKLFASIGGATLAALGIKKTKNAIKKEEKHLKQNSKRETWIKNIKLNSKEDETKLYETKRQLKVLFEVVERRENELPKFFKFSDITKRKLYIDVKSEIEKYKNRSTHTKEEKARFREVRDYEMILQNEEVIKKISRIKRIPRKLIHGKLEKDVYNYKKEKALEKNNVKESKNDEITVEIDENVI